MTLRVGRDVPHLRRERFVGLIKTQISLSQAATFRIVHFCIENTHIHIIAEAEGSECLSSGLGVLKFRIAHRLNRELGRSGAFFDDRYHTRSLSTPREVRNALCYVLNNERHHAEDRGERLPVDWFDPYSSAVVFDGWASPLVLDEPWKRDLARRPSPVVPPTTWLLRTGWRIHGPLQLEEVPGRRRQRKKRVT